MGGSIFAAQVIWDAHVLFGAVDEPRFVWLPRLRPSQNEAEQQSMLSKRMLSQVGAAE